jgi:hypothetical protein
MGIFLFVTAFRFCQRIISELHVQRFYLCSCPGGLSQELQAGLDARVIGKTSDRDDPSQFLPPMMFHQLVKHHFQRDPVKRVFLLLVGHIYPVYERGGAFLFSSFRVDRVSGKASSAYIKSRENGMKENHSEHDGRIRRKSEKLYQPERKE